METLITVIGRGHSGTRAISHTLSASGVYMGSQQNPSGDKIPPHAMYDACRVMAQYVKWNGGLSWNFEPLFTMPIDPEFEQLINTYLADVLRDKSIYKGWKIPETTLIYPWIVRMFPEIRYIHWIRDPRDCILGSHKTDNLRDFGIEYQQTDDVYERRAISWDYQYQLMKATPKPKHVIQVRFEDFVLKQEETLKRLEAYLGIPLGRIIVRPEAVERWKKVDAPCALPFEFLREAIVENGYALAADSPLI
jgi:hypothetical protein